MLSKFQEKFDTFYNDPEFNFKADDRLIAMICASLQYENFDLKDKINMADNQEQDESSHDSGEEDNKKKMPELDEIVEELD